jgi:NADPH-dependent curcumin reductase CurA
VDPALASFATVLIKRLRVQGFIVIDYADKFVDAATQLGKWKMFGNLKDRETIVEGLEKVPDAINMLFSGGNIGKLIVKV